MARQYQKGTDLIRKSAEKKSRRFTPNIYWKPGDVHIVAWLTEAGEIPKVLLHQMVKVPDDNFDSGFRYETLLCKKDSSMVDDFGGACELCDHVGHEATERFVALAVELEPIREGKRIVGLKVKTNTAKNKDGVDTDYPRWGYVAQASKNFFAYFAAYADSSGDIRDVAWEIQREGESTNTKYHSFIVMNGPNAVPLPDLSKIVDEIPTLEDILEDMGSEEKYATVADLAPGSQPTFGNKPKQQESGTVPGGSRASAFEQLKDEVEAY